MKTQAILDYIKSQLDDIHDLLFSGEATKEDLMDIKEFLLGCKEDINDIKEINDIVNKKMKFFGKILQLIFKGISLFTISLVLLGIIHPVIGAILFAINFYGSKDMQEEIKKLEDDEISNKISEILKNIEYKEEITNKKLNNIERMQQLKTEPIPLDTNELSIPQIKMVRTLELKR